MLGVFEPPPLPPDTIAHAKHCIAPSADLAAWATPAGEPAVTVAVELAPSSSSSSSCVAVGGRRFRDNAARLPGLDFADDTHGDTLPTTPAVLTGLLDLWPAFADPGRTWSVGDLATRTGPEQRVSLDGGPSFARMSIGRGRTSLREYQRYCGSGEAGGAGG